ncbi:MAG: serine hydrolase [Leptospira sp.]|nr:serine hydrolase [Leptospira sp.]
MLTEKYIRDLIDKAINKHSLPAVSISIMNSERILIQSFGGTRILGQDNRISSDDYFHIGSCTKSVVATIAGKMVEEGKIQWDTKFLDLYPKFKSSTREEYQSLCLEDYLLCRAGMPAFTSGWEFENKGELSNLFQSRKSFIEHLLKCEPDAKKQVNGKFEFLYSNASYSMACFMLEEATDLNFQELIQRYLVEGIGIQATLGWPHLMGKKQPWGHCIHKDRMETFDPSHPYKVPDLLSPAGDLSMTANGFAKYVKNHLQGLKGERNFLEPATYQRLHFGSDGFSMGVVNGKFIRHTFTGMDGSAGTFFCRAILVPEEDFAFTIMTNAGSPTGELKAAEWLTQKIAKRHFQWWWMFWV